MRSKISFSLLNKSGGEIGIDCRIPAVKIPEKKPPVTIFAHGFKGFKDWGGFPYMMQKLSDSGYAAVSFNFSHNGVEKENPMEFTRLDLFAENTFSRELDELGIIIDHFYNNAGEFEIDREKISLMGHSRGGGISILKAAEDRRIKCLVTLASVSTFDRYTPELKKSWREKGYFEVLNTRTNRMMRLNSTLLDDLEYNISRLDIVGAAGRLNVPYLIIHGKEDLSVSAHEAEILFEKSGKELTEIQTIENTGHTFGVVHPFAGPTKAFDKVIETIIAFLNKHL